MSQVGSFGNVSRAWAVASGSAINSTNPIQNAGVKVCGPRNLGFLAQGNRIWGPTLAHDFQKGGRLSYAQDLWIAQVGPPVPQCLNRVVIGRGDPLDTSMVTVQNGLSHALLLERTDAPGTSQRSQLIWDPQSLTDPILGTERGQTAYYSWKEATGFARPLAFQKMVVANPHDLFPAFFYPSGLGFIAQESRDFWFQPARLIQGRAGANQIQFSDGLGARAHFAGAEQGKWLPELNWSDAAIQFSLKAAAQTLAGAPGDSGVLSVEALVPEGGVLALGMKPGPHFWNPQKLAEGVTPWFAENLVPRSPVQDARLFKISCETISNCTLLDASGAILWQSSRPLAILSATPFEVLVSLTAGPQKWIFPKTPDTRVIPKVETLSSVNRWNDIFLQGTQFNVSWPRSKVPRQFIEVSNRVRAWLYQIYALARVRRSQREELQYGGHFYTMYFGIEESWPILSLAQLGHFEEAKAQARILASSEHLAKSGQHHQYRNGIALWVVSELARLSGDREFWNEMQPQLRESLEWANRVTLETQASAHFEILKGLLPRHTYGGDLNQGAVSLYSSISVWKGANEWLKTATIFGAGNIETMSLATQVAQRLERSLLIAVASSQSSGFLPLALDLAPTSGQLINEGPYPRLYSDAVGSYWNLFASMALDFNFFKKDVTDRNSNLLTDSMENRGGLWGGIPRFQSGLNSAYVIGYFEELARRGEQDQRSWVKAQNLFTTFMAQGMDLVGYAIPEVAPFVLERMDNEGGRQLYAELMRQGFWNFSMYSGERYLAGHMAITEPLAAGAAEGLRMVTRLLLTAPRRVPEFLKGAIRAEVGPLYSEQGPIWVRVK